MIQKKVLTVVHDPGAQSMLKPVLRELNANKNVALTFLSQANEVEIDQVFSEIKPDVVLTGTSWGSKIEQRLRNLAKKNNVRSIVAIDYWANYLERWNDCDHDIVQIRDEICVVDEKMKSEMVALGFPANLIFVTGHPGLEELSRSAKNKNEPFSIRNVLFLSEPYRDLKLEMKRDEALKLVGETLQKLAIEMDSSCMIHFKLHPKEESKSVDKWKTEFKSRDHLTICESASEIHLPEDFKNFNLIMGYQTMGLLEAAASGYKALSVPFRPLSEGTTAAFQSAGIFILSPDSNQDIENWSSKPAQSKLLYSDATKSILGKVLE